MPDDPAKVVYDVADLLDRIGTRIDTGFATLVEKLDNKADKSDLAAINARLDEQSRRLAEVETWQHAKDAAVEAHQDRDERDNARRNMWLALAAAAATVVIALSSILPQIFK